MFAVGIELFFIGRSGSSLPTTGQACVLQRLCLETVCTGNTFTINLANVVVQTGRDLIFSICEIGACSDPPPPLDSIIWDEKAPQELLKAYILKSIRLFECGIEALQYGSRYESALLA